MRFLGLSEHLSGESLAPLAVAFDGGANSVTLWGVKAPLRSLPRAARQLGRGLWRGLFWASAAAVVAVPACSHARPAAHRSRRVTVPHVAHAVHASYTLKRVSPTPARRASAPLAFSVRDAVTHQLIPCKLTFLGAAGSRAPAFTRDDHPLRIAGGVAAYNRVFSLAGEGIIRVPPGRYDVYVSRGPEWTLHVERGLRVGPRGARLETTLSHVVDSTGYLGGDFHVHAERSFDSVVPMSARVDEFAADGVELIVSTDHNTLSDYAPVIRKLGAERYLTSIVGEEITTQHWGHYGAFPLEVHPGLPRGGAVRVRGRTASQIFAEVRRRFPGALIDVYHPHFPQIGYFNDAKLDAKRAEFHRAGASYAFNALELLNGYRDGDRTGVRAVLPDWFRLLDHGYRFTATGDSDTHHLTKNEGGYPRNYLRVASDRPGALTPQSFAHALRAGRSFLTTGPFVRLSVDGGGLGDTVEARSGKAVGHIEVQAAPWIDVSRVLLFVNGKQTDQWRVPPTQQRDAAGRALHRGCEARRLRRGAREGRAPARSGGRRARRLPRLPRRADQPHLRRR